MTNPPADAIKALDDVEARKARVARYLSDQAAARKALESHPAATGQRLRAWQEGQGEWFSDTLLEIVAEFIAFENASTIPSPAAIAEAEASIVAWLRTTTNRACTDCNETIADAIEAGEHLAKEARS